MSRLDFFTVILALITMATASMTAQHCDARCYPGARCWPAGSQFLELYQQLPGRVLSSYDKDYRNHVLMINTRVTKWPYLIVIAQSVQDVQTAVKFANKYNLRVTIRSSGHDYIGRSTWDGSLQINLSNMTDLKFNLNSSRHSAGEVTAQSGNSWLRVYKETSKLGRLVVGGSAHTVSMGGYTLGGGHSPIGRKFGMAVDNLLEVEMITANGSLVYADEHGTRYTDSQTGVFYQTSDTDIFWAVRGGGGSTFGIVTAFTYKLHYDTQVVALFCSAPMFVSEAKSHDEGRAVLETFHKIVPSLAPEWGGLELATQSGNITTGVRATVILALNHFGPYGSASYDTIKPFRATVDSHCKLTNYSNFLEYILTDKEPLYYRSYIFNTLMQPDDFTPDWYGFLRDLIHHPLPDTKASCTGVLLGGNMRKIPAHKTSVHPNFRSAMMSLTCGLSWTSPSQDEQSVALAEKYAATLMRFGNGSYFNNPSSFQPNWKSAYWGEHYERLLQIKKLWDPWNVFTCHHCVGSDLFLPESYVPILVG